MIENKERFITLKFDLMFKKVFGDKNHKRPIRYLLKEILNINPKSIEILNSEIIDTPYKDKRVLVDLIVELENKTKIAIEINTHVDDEIIKRNLYYMCKNISKDLKSDNNYQELPRHIQINFDFEGKHKSGIERYTLYDKSIKKELTDVIEIIRIDVPYYNKLCYTIDIEKLDSLTKFIGLFGVKTKEEARVLCEGDKNMEEIYDRLKEYNEDNDLIGVYDYELDRLRLTRSSNKKQWKKDTLRDILMELKKEQSKKQSKLHIIC